MKKSYFIFFVLTALSFTACAKSKKAENQAVTENEKNVQLTNPEIIKLNKVLSSMSERCKAAIPNGNPEEFLEDLHKVLDSRKEFSADDLSPFYLIDKTHTVGADYEPKGLVHLENCSAYNVNKNNLSLRPEAYHALFVLAKAAKSSGVTLTISSSYRSYEYQKNLFDYWVKVDGLEEAERESARPGTSQHQLGLALDFAPVDDEFDKTPGGKWVYEHASDYGWSLSFPKGYEDVTGYRWECWHFRYIGKEACRFQKKWFSDVQQFMIEFIDAWNQQ